MFANDVEIGTLHWLFVCDLCHVTRVWYNAMPGSQEDVLTVAGLPWDSYRSNTYYLL